VAAVVVLLVWTTPLAAALAVLAVFFYAVVYTLLLKRRTSQNIVWGGAAGCFPVHLLHHRQQVRQLAAAGHPGHFHGFGSVEGRGRRVGGAVRDSHIRFRC